MESGMGQAPEDGEDGIEKSQGGGDSGFVHVTPGDGHREVGTDLAGRARSTAGRRAQTI